MTTTKTIQEDKLLMAARLFDEEELKALVKFIQGLIKKKQSEDSAILNKASFETFLEDVRNKAAENGLTEEILENILAQDE